MRKNNKYSVDQKVNACELYLSGQRSAQELALSLNMGKSGKRLVLRWVEVYKIHGKSCFLKTSRNSTYTKELKLCVVAEYLQGRGSLNELAIKYNIRAHSTIYTWLLRYTKGDEIKSYNLTPEVSMNKTRVTTLEERLEIVEHCLSHEKNYKLTASKYELSYGLVYGWVSKYLKEGPESLLDNRGRKIPEVFLSEAELQKRKIEKLERKNKELEMELELLKKLQELGRRR